MLRPADTTASSYLDSARTQTVQGHSIAQINLAQIILFVFNMF
jgi:hypothetical protein